MAIPCGGSHTQAVWKEVAKIAGEEALHALEAGRRPYMLGDRQRPLSAAQLFHVAKIASRGAVSSDPMSVRITNVANEARITTWFGDGWKRRWRTTLTFE